MPVRQANFLVVCAFAAIGLAALLAGWFATGTSEPAQARMEAPAEAQIDPLQTMTNSKDLPAAHYDDYSIVFN